VFTLIVILLGKDGIVLLEAFYLCELCPKLNYVSKLSASHYESLIGMS
jgi:hypothetical protein